MTRLRLIAVAAPLAVAALVLSACGTTAASDDALHSPSADATQTDSSEPTTSAPADNVLLTVDTPTDGQVISDGKLVVSGTANSPEANVPYTIEDSAGSVITNHYFTADGWMDKLYPYTGTIDVSSYEPGTYTLTVKVDDLSDGEGATPQQIQRTFVIPSGD